MTFSELSTVTGYLSSEACIIFFASIGYWLASGAARSDYKLLHVVLGITSFFILGKAVYHVVGWHFEDHAVLRIAGAGFVVMLSAYFWKRYLAEKVFFILQEFGITTIAFGPERAWDNFISTPGRVFCYYHVYLTNGDRISSDQDGLTMKKNNNEIDFESNMNMDEEGNVVFVATETQCGKTGTTEESIIVDEGRMKFTYIPASNIRKIEAFVKPEGVGGRILGRVLGKKI